MFNNRICYTFLCVEYNPYFRVVVFIPAFFEEKRDYVLPFVIHPSVRPSVCPSDSSSPASPPTLLMLESPNICMIPLGIQRLTTYLKFFSVFQF